MLSKPFVCGAALSSPNNISLALPIAKVLIRSPKMRARDGNRVCHLKGCSVWCGWGCRWIDHILSWLLYALGNLPRGKGENYGLKKYLVSQTFQYGFKVKAVLSVKVSFAFERKSQIIKFNRNLFVCSVARLILLALFAGNF